MKKILSLAFAALLITGTVSAQEIPERKSEDAAPKHRMKDAGMRQAKDLDLTEDQKTKMKALREEYRTKEKELQAKNLSEQDLRDQRVALHKEQQSKMQSMLTDEQKAKMEKAKAEGKKKGEEGKKRGEFGGKTRGERGDKESREKFAKELNLTADQKTKMEASRKETGEKIKAIREDKSLTDEQKKEKRKTIMQEQKKANESILTEDQKKMIKEKHKDGHRKHKRKASATEQKTV